ncbi:MAG: diaminopimelate decarboxylase [Bacteroidota bacterium]|nr:diaminopimelate decarboxylase [Bacteroidota bacterium]
MIDADGFSYRDGELHCGGVPLTEIAAHAGTPTYVYDLDGILARYASHMEAFAGLRHEACYAVKANASLPLLQLLAQNGAGFDVNSRGELHRALRAGADPGRITMTGVGKSRADISDGLDAGIARFNAESASECRLISDTAAEKDMVADVLLRLNPDVETDTHPHISTGESSHKFGMSSADIRSLAAQSAWLPGARIRGLSFHLGSQIFSPAPYREALLPLITTLDEITGVLGISDPVIDIGGGFGVAYNDEEQTLELRGIADILRSLLGPRIADFTLLTEPGRSLVANSGVLITAVEHEKPAHDRIFLILDAGMNDLLRPALYGARHDIVPLREPEGGQTTVFYDVVGPVCESADTFAQRYPLPQLKRGDLLALLSAGAYGASMSSTYNSRPLAAEAIVYRGEWKLGRERQGLEDLLRGERLLTEPAEPRD